MYQSFWTLTANPDLLASAPLLGAAKVLGKTPAQVLFRFLIQRGAAPLTGTTSTTHMREDLDVMTWELDDKTVRAIGDVIGEKFDDVPPTIGSGSASAAAAAGAPSS